MSKIKTPTPGAQKFFNGKMLAYIIGGLVVVAGFIITFQYVDPAPPKVLTIFTGGSSGAYYGFAKKYSEILKREGITLKVKETKGSVENVGLLLKEGRTDQLAFVQGGIEAPGAELISLGSLYFEPLWVFHRADFALDQLTQLKGKRVAVGSPGSGTRALADALLLVNGIDEKTSTLVPLSGDDAAAKLLAGEVDVLFLVSSPNAPLIQTLFKSDKLKIMSFRHAEAYARKFSYLSVLTLPEGALDFAANLPQGEIKLLATTANLVAPKNLHPAIINLILEAATEVHAPHGLFERARQFPSENFTSLPLSAEAKEFYKHGPPFLQRYLPFSLASALDRLKIMLLPLLGLLLPIFKIVPPMYKWRVRSKIYRWYTDLRLVDPELVEVSPDQVLHHVKKLDQIEDEVTRITVPLSYADQVYNLRSHIDMVRNRLVAISKNTL